MFTGIIGSTGRIIKVSVSGNNRIFRIESNISDEFRPEESVNHDGVCLTVESVDKGCHTVTAIAETLAKTALSSWQEGYEVNLERAMFLGGRLDGHIVQGHTDTTGICENITEKNGSSEFLIGFPPAFAELVIEKGSICLNGISLTAFNVTENSFTVAIIPYTLQHTNLSNLKPGDPVNLEFDIIGKYVEKLLRFKV